MKSFLLKVLARFCRSPDVYIGGRDNPYLLRWHIIPRNRLFNIYLHKFLRSDDDRAIHDHPWPNCSILLSGSYHEHVLYANCCYALRATLTHPIMRRRGSVVFRRAAWFLFITGPRIREWGFLCPKAWRHWKEFCDPIDHGQVGRECK